MSARLAALLVVVSSSLPARAGFLAAEPMALSPVPTTLVSVCAAAPLAPAPGLAAMTLAPAAPALAASAAPAIAAAAAPASASPAERFEFVVRRGRNRHGHPVLVLDAVDPENRALGAVGHVDVAWHDGQASLDEPLDFWVDDAAPSGAAFSHWREHLWFGLAVLPEYAGAGLGSRLLDEAAARLRAEGVSRLFIRATESSVGFYRRHYGARLLDEDATTDGDGATDYRLEIDLDAR